MNAKQIESDVVRRASPFLKWAGGKSQLISQMREYLPSDSAYDRYFEPFLGGGALFFYLAPRDAYLSDVNVELINCYRVVEEKLDLLIDDLRKHEYKRSYYYRVRNYDPALLTDVERASLFIFLNKSCYNGLYRVNSERKFNVPFGRHKSPNIVNELALSAASAVLRTCAKKVVCCSYEVMLQAARKDDFVYLDPPYCPLSSTANFTSYTEKPFDIREQQKLAREFRRLDKTGCKVLLSNSDTEMVQRLYRNYSIIRLNATRMINCISTKRTGVPELLVKNF